jgi:hypothetical protein
MAAATTNTYQLTQPAIAGLRAFVGMRGAAAALIADQPRGH